jgi:hypothetical protein
MSGLYNNEGNLDLDSERGFTSQNYPWAIVYDASGVNSGTKEKQPLITNALNAYSALDNTQGQSGKIVHQMMLIIVIIY